MTSLKSQRRLAAEILKAGENRVWMDPERMFDVELAITREEIRKLIHEGAIKRLPEKGVSGTRTLISRGKKKKGRGRGHGSRSGSSHAKISKKEAWMSKIRALRVRLRKLKTNRMITKTTYRRVYKMASSGRFESVADMERHLKTQGQWRKR